MAVNEKRIRSVVKYIEKNAANVTGKKGKKFFDMREYVVKLPDEQSAANYNEWTGTNLECGTYMCFAGWAAKKEGKKFQRNEWSDDSVTYVSLEGGQRISNWAADYFGLTFDEAFLLFEDFNSTRCEDDLGMLKTRITELFGIEFE